MNNSTSINVPSGKVVKKRRSQKHKSDLKMVKSIIGMVENLKTNGEALVRPKELTDYDKKFVRVVKKDGSVRLVEKKSP